MDYLKAERICHVLQKDINGNLPDWKPSPAEHVVGTFKLQWRRHLAILCLYIIYTDGREGFVTTVNWPDGDFRQFLRDINSTTGDRTLKTIVAQAFAYDAVHG